MDPNPTPQQNDEEARSEAENLEIQAAKAAAGIAYKVLRITVPDLDDEDKPGRALAFRRPNDSEWHRYRSEALDPNPQTKARALHSIVIPCCLYPARAEFLRLVAERPGLVELCGGELVEFAGLVRAKKVERQ